MELEVLRFEPNEAEAKTPDLVVSFLNWHGKEPWARKHSYAGSWGALRSMQD